MARLMRAFTFDSTVCRALDHLLGDPEALEILFPSPTSSEMLYPINASPLDDHDLKPGDYAVLHSMAGTKPAKPSTGWDTKYTKPKSDWELLLDALVATQDPVRSNKTLAEAGTLAKLNRRERRKVEIEAKKLSSAPPPRRSSINASRVAEALLQIGIATVKRERSKQLESARSSESHDSQGQVKRPRRKANKVAAFGAIHGRS